MCISPPFLKAGKRIRKGVCKLFLSSFPLATDWIVHATAGAGAAILDPERGPQQAAGLDSCSPTCRRKRGTRAGGWQPSTFASRHEDKWRQSSPPWGAQSRPCVASRPPLHPEIPPAELALRVSLASWEGWPGSRSWVGGAGGEPRRELLAGESAREPQELLPRRDRVGATLGGGLLA